MILCAADYAFTEVMMSGLSCLKIVRVGRSVSREVTDGLAVCVENAFRCVISDIRMVQYDPPSFDEIEAGILTKALNEEIGGHILGVTDADLIDGSGDSFFNFMFGGKDSCNAVAIVSTKRLVQRDGKVPVGRVLKVALHELGHNFGLVHHYSLKPAVDGDGYCPMSKGDYNRFGERGYLRAIVDGRGLSFCQDCIRGMFIARDFF